ncbi:MAG: putative toxin-antitoxin system toxin component, PIN family [Balneolaceae bacterium]|nr:putative toxin-antitoxin system toxin component, PIN family [Balneolaceae bacterium]
MKVFADTNFLISAFATRGLSVDVFQLILSEHELVLGEFILTEFKRVILTKIKLPEKYIDEVEQLLRQFDVQEIPENKSEIIIRDQDDRWVLQSAINAQADILITGDKDLLEIADQIDKPKILTPRQFWEFVQS